MENNDNLAKNLTCILFPGNVKNFDKALDCLGGVKAIEKAVSGSSHDARISLSFHPENPYARKVNAEKSCEIGLLLKVRIRKRKEGNKVLKEFVSSTIVGRVENVYKFEGLFDIQYLPLINEVPGQKPKCIFEKLVPDLFTSAEFVKSNPPLFILPPTIMKFDKPHSVSYMDKVLKLADQTENDGVINFTHRQKFSFQVIFNLVDPLPTDPVPEYKTRLEERIALFPQLKEQTDIVAKLLEERPIISRFGIAYETKIPLYTLKLIMPCLACYVNGGPWHSMWMRFGYDPRTEPEARQYQVLDLRVKNKVTINKRRLPLIKTPATLKLRKKIDDDNDPNNDQVVSTVEAWFRLRPGQLPEQKQVFYQLCEIKLPEVMEIVSNLPEVMPGSLCHPKRGWLPPGALDNIRQAVLRYINDSLGMKAEPGSDSSNSSSDEEQPEYAEGKSDEEEPMDTDR